LPKAESLMETVRKTTEENRGKILEITSKTSEILESARRQLVKVEEMVGDVSSRAKVQMDRVELVLDDTMTRAQETVSVVHNGVMRPVRELNGIAAGIRAAIAHLARGGRPSVDQATADEEMFI